MNPKASQSQCFYCLVFKYSGLLKINNNIAYHLAVVLNNSKALTAAFANWVLDF